MYCAKISFVVDFYVNNSLGIVHIKIYANSSVRAQCLLCVLTSCTALPTYCTELLVATYYYSTYSTSYLLLYCTALTTYCTVLTTYCTVLTTYCTVLELLSIKKASVISLLRHNIYYFLTQCVKKLLQLITMYECYINIQHSDDI